MKLKCLKYDNLLRFFSFRGGGGGTIVIRNERENLQLNAVPGIGTRPQGRIHEFHGGGGAQKIMRTSRVRNPMSFTTGSSLVLSEHYL